MDIEELSPTPRRGTDVEEHFMLVAGPNNALRLDYCDNLKGQVSLDEILMDVLFVCSC